MRTLTAKCGCEIKKGDRVTVICEHGREYKILAALRGATHKIIELTKKPKIICLCGSTRFSQAFQDANLNCTLNGHIVLSIGCDMKSDDRLFSGKSLEEKNGLKRRLDVLHFRKIDIADEVLILNVGGYIGESTARELEYARNLGKGISFLEGGNDQ